MSNPADIINPARLFRTRYGKVGLSREVAQVLAIPFLRKALVHGAGVVQRGLAAGSGAPVCGEYGDGSSLGPESKVIRSQVKPDGEVNFAATMKDPVQGKAKMTIIGPITPHHH
jgi:hypothetical protein